MTNSMNQQTKPQTQSQSTSTPSSPKMPPQMVNDDIVFQMEILGYDQSIALARLEEAKAQERTREIEFQKARYVMEFNKMMIKKAQDMIRDQQQLQPK